MKFFQQSKMHYAMSDEEAMRFGAKITYLFLASLIWLFAVWILYSIARNVTDKRMMTGLMVVAAIPAIVIAIYWLLI
jgi:hypothetical protein